MYVAICTAQSNARYITLVFSPSLNMNVIKYIIYVTICVVTKDQICKSFLKPCKTSDITHNAIKLSIYTGYSN